MWYHGPFIILFCLKNVRQREDQPCYIIKYDKQQQQQQALGKNHSNQFISCSCCTYLQAKT